MPQAEPTTFLESFEQFVRERYALAVLDGSLVVRKRGDTGKWTNGRLIVIQCLRAFLTQAGREGIDSFNGALIETTHSWLRAGAAPIEKQVTQRATAGKALTPPVNFKPTKSWASN
jgi:hypothetical protein